MIDLAWNFPLLAEQAEVWARYLGAEVAAEAGAPVEALRPSFRGAEGELRARAARWLGWAGEERVWLTGGGHQGTLVALLASGVAGTRVVCEALTYAGFLDQCRLTRTEVLGCRSDGEGMEPEALRALCVRAERDRRPVRGVFLMPTVQNPVGFVAGPERRRAVVAVAREFGLAVLEDDAYGFLAGEGEGAGEGVGEGVGETGAAGPGPPESYAELAPERGWYVRGLSKSFAPGCRTGVLVAPAGAAGEVAAALKVSGTGVAVPQVRAVLRMAGEGVLQRVEVAKREEGRGRNADARRVLAEAGLTVAPGAAAAWHLWVGLPAGCEPEAAEAAAEAAGVRVSGGQWSATLPEARFGVRLGLGGEVERGRAMEGVARVVGVLRGFYGRSGGRLGA